MAQNDDLSFLDHYFRHLYRIIKYVDDQRELFSLKERYEYVCLLRAQLSDYELGLVLQLPFRQWSGEIQAISRKICIIQ